MALNIIGSYTLGGVTGYNKLIIFGVAAGGKLNARLRKTGGTLVTIHGTGNAAKGTIEFMDAAKLTIVNVTIFNGNFVADPNAPGGVGGFAGPWSRTKLKFDLKTGKFAGFKTERGKWWAKNHRLL